MDLNEDNGKAEPRPQVRIGGRRLPVPRTRCMRLALGGGLVIGGMLGFLPVLGFWMIPLGLLVLAHDFPAARRIERAGRRRVVRGLRAWRGPRHKYNQK